MVQSGAQAAMPTHAAAPCADSALGARSAGRRDVEDALRLRLVGGSDAAGGARRALARLRADVDEPTMETAQLLVTELVGNSVKHADAQTVDLEVIVTPSAVWAEVTDEGPGFEPLSEEEMVASDSGWGLFLVERLADGWGVSKDGPRTRVWFELRRR